MHLVKSSIAMTHALMGNFQMQERITRLKQLEHGYVSRSKSTSMMRIVIIYYILCGITFLWAVASNEGHTDTPPSRVGLDHSKIFY